MVEQNSETATAASHQLVIKRVFAASPEVVFDAWLDPATAGQWLFATLNGEMVRVEIDARVGSTFTVVEKRGGTLAEHWGTYIEIDRPQRLVFTFTTQLEEKPTLVTVEIAPVVGGCELTLTQEITPQWLPYAERTREGWSQILANLATTISANRELTLIRVFDAPRSLVFKVWTQPEHFARWLGPKDFIAIACQMNVKVGGIYRACIRLASPSPKGSPEGKDHWMQGVYQEVIEPERLVFTFAWKDENSQPKHETLVTVTFEEQDNKTLMTFHQAIFESIESRDSHRTGWSECFDRLRGYLATVTT